MAKPTSTYCRRHADSRCSTLARHPSRDLLPKLSLNFAPKRRSAWRVHRPTPRQLDHPTCRPSHKYLICKRCCDDRLNPPSAEAHFRWKTQCGRLSDVVVDPRSQARKFWENACMYRHRYQQQQQQRTPVSRILPVDLRPDLRARIGYRSVHSQSGYWKAYARYLLAISRPG
jgi:hypothetical protein